MEVKKIPWIVVIGVLIILLLYGMSFYSKNKVSKTKPNVETNSEIKSIHVADENTPVETATEIKDTTQPVAGFPMDLKVLLHELPRRGFAQKQGQDTHTIPQAILKGAIEVGKVADEYTKNPTLKPQALEFYLSCVKEAEVVPQIRAVCYERARILTSELHHKKLMLDVPKEVLDLVGE